MGSTVLADCGCRRADVAAAVPSGVCMPALSMAKVRPGERCAGPGAPPVGPGDSWTPRPIPCRTSSNWSVAMSSRRSSETTSGRSTGSGGCCSKIWKRLPTGCSRYGRVGAARRPEGQGEEAVASLPRGDRLLGSAVLCGRGRSSVGDRRTAAADNDPVAYPRPP